MNNYQLKVLNKLPKTIAKKMEQGFAAYETRHGIDVNYKKFSLVLTDSEGDAFGVLNAYTAFSEVYIDDLWVEESQRGKGYGRILLRELENRFKGKGFNNINLVTSAFQAPEFYRKCGYAVEFVRVNNKNPQLTKTFFIKYFDDDIQKQGILVK